MLELRCYPTLISRPLLFMAGYPCRHTGLLSDRLEMRKERRANTHYGLALPGLVRANNEAFVA